MDQHIVMIFFQKWTPLVGIKAKEGSHFQNTNWEHAWLSLLNVDIPLSTYTPFFVVVRNLLSHKKGQNKYLQSQTTIAAILC